LHRQYNYATGYSHTHGDRRTYRNRNTADTRLSDDEGKMICTISQGFFPELTEEQEAMLSVFPAITEDDWS